MAVPDDDPSEGTPLNERLLDLFVFVPAGIVASAVEEFPKLAALGREKLGVRVSSARAVGKFAMKTGGKELRRRSGGLLGRDIPTSAGDRFVRSPASGPHATRGPVGASVDTPGSKRPTAAPGASPMANGHVPAVSTLSIPGFDTLSASQVVQRLDGLNREELVSVRAYETSNRGRRTILNRVDQLLDERS